METAHVKESLAIPAHAPGLAFLQCLPGYLHPRHRHDELEMNLVLRGSATYQVHDRIHAIERGSLLWLLPEQEHHVIAKSDDYTVWIVYWRADAIESAARADPAFAAFRMGDSTSWHARRLSEPNIKQLALPLDHAAEIPSSPLAAAALSYVLALAWSLGANAENVPPRSSLHPSIERAARLIAQHELLSLRELGQRCGLSPARLSSLFSRQMGVPLSEYRNLRRLDRFLAEHDPRSINLTASALNAGFGSYSQFHRVFSAHMKMSPSAWVAREREQPMVLDRHARGRRV